MRYVAIINVPGCLPDSTEPPPTFDTPNEAWEYLANERRDAEDFAEMDLDDEDRDQPYSETVSDLDAKAAAALDVNRMGWDGTGSVSGSTPGYIGEDDRGVVYEVQESETTTLAAFLLDRISETVAQVTGAQGAAVSYDGWHTVDCGTGIGYWANGECTCRYVDRVLADCEAKRRIVAEHRDNLYGYCSADDLPLPCPTLRLLAVPHADHPDYRPEWQAQ